MKKNLIFWFVFLLLFRIEAFGQEVRRAIVVRFPAPSQAIDVPSTNNNLSAQWQCTAEWLARDPALQEAWGDYRDHRYNAMRQWSIAELPSRIPRPVVVRYLFGGPDLLSVMAYFPDASTYILCGKEPVGKMLSLQALRPDQQEEGLNRLRAATKTFLQFGYFITKEMRSQMNSGPFQGVMPLFLMFLAFTDHQIISVETPMFGGAPGLRIRFLNESRGSEQQLLYVQTELSNGNRSIFKWLSSFGRGAAYLKAASYLLHETEFSQARELLLKYSDDILQDDSGIPLKYFNGDWTLYLFGDYKGPIELFQKYYQSDLATAYGTSPLHGPMPFGTGYQINSGESGGANLLLGVRRIFAPRAKVAR